jgi:DNA topoisomerase I
MVREFYKPLEAALDKAAAAPRVEEETDERCEKCGRPMVVRWGRFGRFLACSGFPECRHSRPLAGEGGELQATDEKCDICGQPMVIRRGRYGPFLACSNYPTCRGTRRLLAKVGIACPECGGDIVAKKTGRGRTFYGCSNYPKCRFTSWSRPLPQACPKCGGPLAARAGGKAKCLKCSWQGARPRKTREEASA